MRPSSIARRRTGQNLKSSQKSNHAIKQQAKHVKQWQSNAIEMQLYSYLDGSKSMIGFVMIERKGKSPNAYFMIKLTDNHPSDWPCLSQATDEAEMRTWEESRLRHWSKWTEGFLLDAENRMVAVPSN